MVAILTPPVAVPAYAGRLGQRKATYCLYIERHNTTMPHSAFLGQTPDEISFGTEDHVPAELKAGHQAAQQRRLTENRAARCRLCDPMDAAPMEALLTAETLDHNEVAHAELSEVFA